MKPKKAEIVILGAGNRGHGYATYAKEHPEQARIVGVAEPRAGWRNRLVQEHDIPPENIVDDWRELASRPKFADAAIVATQDSMHTEPAVAFTDAGYHVLLEKPMAPNADDCKKITEAALKNGNVFAVCHVLRYTPYTRKLKKLLDSGIIGDVVSIQRLEPVGYWHQAHSYVRGNWRNEAQSSSMLLAKSCHDLDWIRHIIGNRCTDIQSFGTLKHFRDDQKPEGAGDRCLDCAIEPSCPYSAKKIYLEAVKKGRTSWPVDVLTPDVTIENVTEALRTGPYGRCVYSCDNDVVDNQVVNMLFETGQTASFTMTAFCPAGHRKTRIFGTRCQVEGDGNSIRYFDFLSDTWEEIKMDPTDATILGGHGGGDYGLMSAFVDAVRHDDPSKILSGPKETLETHLMVFAAEISRVENRLVSMTEML